MCALRISAALLLGLGLNYLLFGGHGFLSIFGG